MSDATVGTRRPTTAKILGTLGVVGAIGAVAGLTTFGNFTDATTPVDTTVETGVLSIDVTAAANYVPMPIDTDGMLPGDSRTMPFDLVNDGDLDLSSVTFTSVASQSSALDTDAVHGLQLAIESCSQPWDVVGTAYSCAGTMASHYSGPVVVERVLRDAGTLAADGVDHLLATLSLPSTAGESMKGQTSELAMTFTAVQREGESR